MFGVIKPKLVAKIQFPFLEPFLKKGLSAKLVTDFTHVTESQSLAIVE